MQFIIILVLGIIACANIKRFKIGESALMAIMIMLILIMLDFFGFSSKGNKAIIIFTVPFIFIRRKQLNFFEKNIWIFLGGLISSMISCSYFRGQQINESFWLYTSLFGFLFYFLFKAFNLSIQNMEKALIILSILFIVSYIIQYIVYPFVIFNGAEQEYIGDLRIRLSGQALAPLAFFYSLNKLLLRRNIKLLYILLLLSSLFVIVLMGFRTMLAGLLIMTFVTTYRIYGLNFKLALAMLFFLSVSLLALKVPIVEQKLDSMSRRQKTDNISNSDYIRIAQLTYYTQEHFKSWVELLFGSGLPQRGNPGTNTKATSYGTYMDELVKMGLNWVDWGLYSLSWVVGIVPPLIIVINAIKSFRIKLKAEYTYLGIWFIYLVTISFTTMEIFRPGNLALQAFCFVLIERIYTSHKLTNKQYRSKNADVFAT